MKKKIENQRLNNAGRMKDKDVDETEDEHVDGDASARYVEEETQMSPNAKPSSQKGALQPTTLVMQWLSVWC